jgi:hypothetical protein
LHPQDAIANAEFGRVIQHSHEVFLWDRVSELETGRGFPNEQNRVARLDPQLGSLQYRGRFTAQWEPEGTASNLQAHWAPRALFFLALPGWREDVAPDEGIDWEFMSQTARLRINIGDAWQIQGGRYRLDFGPSTFVAPSNPFVIGTGRINPKVEQRPRDFLQSSYSGADYSLTAIANLGQGEDTDYQDPFFDFKRRYALLLDLYGMAGNFSGLLSREESDSWRLGAFGQYNLSPSILAWSDLALELGPRIYYPQSMVAAPGWRMTESPTDGNAYYAALLGASYTTFWGPTVSLEGYRNDMGFTEGEWNRLDKMTRELSTRRYDASAALARGELARGLNSGRALLRRNYLFAQISEADRWAQVDYNVRSILNLDDGGGQLSLLVEWNFHASWQMFVVGLAGVGERESEFMRFLPWQFMGGFIYRI